MTQDDQSQFGEQSLILQVLADIEDGCAVEVGAVDGVYLSTTKALEDKGWAVLCIEPNPFYWPALVSNRKLCMPYACSDMNRELVPFNVYDNGNGDFTAGSGFSTNLEELAKVGVPKPKQTFEFKLPVRTLDYCLDAGGFQKIDFVSIDAEGHDFAVLRGFDLERWQPRAILFENWHEGRQFVEFFKDTGYVRAARVGVSDLYVKP